MKHELTDFVDDHYRASFESGRLKDGYEAALFCVANGVPIPEWLCRLVEDALQHDALCSEGRGRGRKHPLAESAISGDRKFIVFQVDMLSESMPKRQAFEEVAKDLSRHRCKLWTAEMVKTEYYRHR